MRRLGLALTALVLIAPTDVQAQAPPDPAATDRAVAERLEQAKAVYGVKDPRAACRPKVGDEIVVCADHGQDQGQAYVRPYLLRHP